MKIFNFYKKNIGYIIKQNGPVKAFQTLRVRGQRNWLPGNSLAGETAASAQASR